MDQILHLNKRRKIIIAAAVLTIGLLSTQLVDFNIRFRFLTGLAILSYILSVWALFEGLSITKAIVLMILPTSFTLSVASFYFLLPIRWLTRLPVAFGFGLVFYLLLLAQNVFNVASLRTIPLYRAASTASFLFTLLSAFFLYDVIFAFNLYFLWSGLVVFLVSFPLILQVLWSIKMEEKIGAAIVVQSFILSLVLGEFALSFSFWPFAKNSVMWAMSLSSAMYVFLGLATSELRGKISRRVVTEYVVIGMVVFLVSFLTTSWTG